MSVKSNITDYTNLQSSERHQEKAISDQFMRLSFLLLYKSAENKISIVIKTSFYISLFSFMLAEEIILGMEYGWGQSFKLFANLVSLNVKLCTLRITVLCERESEVQEKIKTALCSPWDNSHTISFTETQAWSISAPLHWVEYSFEIHAASPFCLSQLLDSQTTRLWIQQLCPKKKKKNQAWESCQVVCLCSNSS